MENLEERLVSKLAIAKECMEFFQGAPNETLEEINQSFLDMNDLKQGLEVLKSSVEKLKTQKLQAEQISYYIKDKIQICASIEDTLPKRIHSASSVDNQQNDSQQTRQSQPKEGKSAQTVAIEKRAECGVPKLRYISLDDFNRVPKYMKGRLSYDGINQAINDFNSAVQTRYDFLSKGFQAYSSMAQKKRYKEMKSQETRETRGVFFVVAEDLKSYDSLKSEASRRTLFTIFRHLKLIFESRENATTKFCVYEK